MGINLKTGIYGCWRAKYTHKGKDVSSLLAKITRESRLTIRRAIGLSLVIEDNDAFHMMTILNSSSEDKEVRVGGSLELKLPKQFKPLWEKEYTAEPYVKYLKSRGFSNVRDMAYEYMLYYSCYGDWNYRIIYPIFMDRKLVSWVGRSIHPQETIKYLDLSIEKSVVAPKYSLGQYDDIKRGGDVLFVTEGYFDSLKLNWYLPKKQKATCLFTSSMTDQQKYMLWNIGKKYSSVIILLDNDAIHNSLVIKSKLCPILNNVSIRTVPDRYGDPGALTSKFIKSGGLLQHEGSTNYGSQVHVGFMEEFDRIRYV
jgi:hypothetical protein